MPRARRLRTAAFRAIMTLAAATVTMLLGSYLAGEWFAFRSEAAQLEVWSAYLNREVRTQTTERRTLAGAPPLIVIQQRTDPLYRSILVALTWPAIARSTEWPGLRWPSSQMGTRSRFLLANLRSHGIPPGLVISAPYRLVAPATLDRGDWDTRFPGSMGYFVLSAVGFNADRTEALLRIDHMCGLCGHGSYVLMRKIDGSWKIEAEAYTWIG